MLEMDYILLALGETNQITIVGVTTDSNLISL